MALNSSVRDFLSHSNITISQLTISILEYLSILLRAVLLFSIKPTNKSAAPSTAYFSSAIHGTSYCF